MKVNPNEPFYPDKRDESCPHFDYTVNMPGVPLKLEIAARFHAALLADIKYGFRDPSDRARVALREADALINEYNKQEEK